MELWCQLWSLFRYVDCGPVCVRLWCGPKLALGVLGLELLEKYSGVGQGQLLHVPRVRLLGRSYKVIHSWFPLVLGLGHFGGHFRPSAAYVVFVDL